MRRQRILQRQARRPQKLAQVTRIRNQSVLQSRAHCELSQRSHCGPLSNKGHNARRGREHEERNLFEKQSRTLNFELRTLNFEPPERPIVQQQQDKWKRHQHWLAQQAEPEEDYRESVIALSVRASLRFNAPTLRPSPPQRLLYVPSIQIG